MNKKKKILILGSTGMLGHVVYLFLKGKNQYEIFDIAYRNKLNSNTIILDVTQKEKLSSTINEIKPDFIINCIGVLINGSKLSASNAIYLNSFLPNFLSELSSINDYKLITISTDCVFSGKTGNYKFNDFRDADDLYGRSKALGELINNQDITIRTSIVGPEIKKNGEGLFHWVMNQNGNVKGFTNVFWSGLTTLELAKFIETAILNYKPGLYQISYSEKISKYDLIKIINEIFKKGLTIEKYDSKKSDKSIVSNFNLSNEKVRNYNQMLSELSQFINNHKEKYYSQYFK